MRFDYALDGPIGNRANLGLIVLEADATIEHEFRRIFPIDGVAIYVSRIASQPEVTPETLATMVDHLAASAALFPKGLHYGAVDYACTSGASVIGSKKVGSLISGQCKVAQCTDPLRALLTACADLKIKRLAVLTPYIRSTSAVLLEAIEGAGIEIARYGSFDEIEEVKVARISPTSIKNAAIALGNDPNFDALFISCTNLRTIDILSEIEAEIDRPVLSSNQLLAWHMAKLAKLELDLPQFRQLFIGA